MRRKHDHGEDITALELLGAVEEHGRDWPLALTHYQADALAEALGREIVAGTLRDAATLTPWGRTVLDALRRDAVATAALPLTTHEVLTAVEEHGKYAVGATGYDRAAMDDGIGREFRAGNLLDATTLSVRGRRALDALRTLPVGEGGVRRALDGRAAVAQAQGVVAAATGLPLDLALGLLRKLARNVGRPVGDVAADIVGRTLLITKSGELVASDSPQQGPGAGPGLSPQL